MQHTENNNPETRATNLEQVLYSSLEPVSSVQQGSVDEIKLLDLLLVLVKHWKMIIGVPFVAAVITAIITLFMPSSYTAKAMIIPSDNDSGGLGAALSQLGGLAAIAGSGVGAKTTGELYVTMLKSETLKDPIIDKYKLMDYYKSKLRSNVYRTLDSVTNISLGKKDGVVTISISDSNPRLAADLTNEYVYQLGKLTTGLNIAGAGYNRIFFEKQIAETKADIGKAEYAIKEFQSKNKTISVSDQARATIEGVAQLRAQLALQEVMLGTLNRQFTDNSQEVKSAKSTIANLRAQIVSLEGKSNGSSSIPNLGSVPQMGQEYLRLMREFKIQEALLEMLTKQYELAKLSETKDISPFQILQKAKAPDCKSKPKRSQIVISTAFITGFLMVLLAFAQEFRQKMLPEDRARWNEIWKYLPDISKPVNRLRRLVTRSRV